MDDADYRFPCVGELRRGRSRSRTGRADRNPIADCQPDTALDRNTYSNANPTPYLYLHTESDDTSADLSVAANTSVQRSVRIARTTRA